MSEKIKNYLGIVIIIAILAIGWTALSLAGSYSRSIISTRSFSVSGEGKVVAVPDIAQFSFQVVTEGGKDIAALQQENTTKVNKAINFLKGKEVDSKDIKTENYNLAPRYQTSNCGYRALGAGVELCPPAQIVGYTINQSVAVKVRDFKLIGAVLSGVVSAGANSVSQLSFTIDKPESLESEARAQAMAEAKAKAQAVARAGGFRLGRLISIDEGQMPIPYYKNYAMESTAAPVTAPTSPTIEPGSQEVKVKLTLFYEIE